MTGRDPEGRLGRKEKKVRINVFDGEESDEWVETEFNGCEFTVVPDEICSLHDSQVTFRRDVSPWFAALMEENGGSLTDGETKKAKIISTGGCSRGDKETPQDPRQVWTGSTRFRKS